PCHCFPPRRHGLASCKRWRRTVTAEVVGPRGCARPSHRRGSGALPLLLPGPAPPEGVGGPEGSRPRSGPGRYGSFVGATTGRRGSAIDLNLPEGDLHLTVVAARESAGGGAGVSRS